MALVPSRTAGPVSTLLTRATQTCLRTCLKACNSITGILGAWMCMYSLRMIGVSLRQMKEHDQTFILPWFVGALLGLGISLCLLACIGHAAAVTRSRICLSFYIVLMLLLLLLETLIIGEVLLNDDWKEDFPDDPTGRLDDFIDHIESKIGFFRRVGLLVAFSQAMSLFLAIILRTEHPVEHRRRHVHQQPLTTATVPFLNHSAWSPTNAGSAPRFVSNKWIEY